MKKLLLIMILLIPSLFAQQNGEIPYNIYNEDGNLVRKILPQDSAAYRAALQLPGRGKYAVFLIPVPPGLPVTDFELKASSFNFQEPNPLAFFYLSSDPTKTLVPQQVWTNRPKVYFTDSKRSGMNPNQRTWIEQGNTSIFAQLVHPSSEVGGFVIILQDDLSQIPNLVWSFTFMSGGSDDGVWYPTWPIDWIDSFEP